MEKIDLFESLIRFLAIKPLELERFNIEQAKDIIQKEREGTVALTSDHEYFESALRAMAKRVSKNETGLGIVYIYVVGDHSKEKLKRLLLEMILSVKKIIIIGNNDTWQITDPKIEFVDNPGIFKDNHQRFFIYQSPSYSLALVARKNETDGKMQTEAAMTNAEDAVSFLSQRIGLNLYKK